MFLFVYSGYFEFSAAAGRLLEKPSTERRGGFTFKQIEK
jgi:hypothetical protein